MESAVCHSSLPLLANEVFGALDHMYALAAVPLARRAGTRPVATAHALGDASAWISACWTFAAFCATASAIYIINDLSDLKADRVHARKKKRPFASGMLSLPTGLAMTAVLLAAGAFFGIGPIWSVDPDAWWRGSSTGR